PTPLPTPTPTPPTPTPLPTPTPTPPTPTPLPTPTPTPTPTPPVVLDQYSGLNKARRRWSASALNDSVRIRKRGIAVGWIMGITHPFTGVGAGQTGFFFDELSEEVRRQAREHPGSALKRFLFVDEEIIASSADKGVFNIFMNAWGETGVLGLIGLLGILITVSVRGLQALWLTRRVSRMIPLRVLFPLFCGVLVIHQTIYLWVHPWLWTIIALTYAAADIAVRNAREQRSATL
ncbi:MAG: hypothetical protein Q7S89_01845, partial [bacterium]|nr:hypothetical protein [bacterium]